MLPPTKKSELTDKIEELVLSYKGTDKIPVYGILGLTGTAEVLTPAEVSKGVLTITLMAFIAGGVTVVHQIEELPLFPAILIHGIALYLDYLLIYLTNGWLADGKGPFLIFTVIFAIGYIIIWLIIYTFTKKSTNKINKNLNF